MVATTNADASRRPGPRDRSVLAELAALHTTPTPALKDRWRVLYGAEPPPFSRSYLESRLAYRIQELALGGLRPETVERLKALGQELDGGQSKVQRVRQDNRPTVGTQLTREYQGIEHSVTVLHDGYEWQGRPYKSLSAVARSITGTRWNGWTFFGLRNRRGGA